MFNQPGATVYPPLLLGLTLSTPLTPGTRGASELCGRISKPHSAHVNKWSVVVDHATVDCLVLTGDSPVLTELPFSSLPHVVTSISPNMPLTDGLYRL